MKLCRRPVHFYPPIPQILSQKEKEKEKPKYEDTPTLAQELEQSFHRGQNPVSLSNDPLEMSSNFSNISCLFQVGHQPVATSHAFECSNTNACIANLESEAWAFVVYTVFGIGHHGIQCQEDKVDSFSLHNGMSPTTTQERSFVSILLRGLYRVTHLSISQPLIQTSRGEICTCPS